MKQHRAVRGCKRAQGGNLFFPCALLYSHRATARSEMEQSGIELARLDASGRKATARSEMERSGIELVRLDASVRKATARSEMERSGIELARLDASRSELPSVPSRKSINMLSYIQRGVFHELYICCHLP